MQIEEEVILTAMKIKITMKQLNIYYVPGILLNSVH